MAAEVCEKGRGQYEQPRPDYHIPRSFSCESLLCQREEPSFATLHGSACELGLSREVS